MPGPPWIAHSARKHLGISVQTYANHVQDVASSTLQHLEQAARFAIEKQSGQKLQIAGAWASTFHDLGKLEGENQAVLKSDEHAPLPYPHEAAGALHCLQQGQRAAAWIIHSHHRGLTDRSTEVNQEERQHEGDSCRPFFPEREDLLQQTLELLPSLLQSHEHAALPLHLDPRKVAVIQRKRDGTERCDLGTFEMRLLLSALVDADHGDTARHYRQEKELNPPEPRWTERLEALERYVGGLGKDEHGNTISGSRDPLRQAVYQDCASSSTNVPIYACDAPVGSGKTTAVMAYLLRAAIEKELRHIFVVLPFTNIINQSVDTYRKALVLAGEDPEQVIAAHHHASEFSSPDTRGMTTLWRSPIIVTTAVQFFETLAACATPRLRKLHALPGSAIFVDEAHAAMPLHLWPSMWDRIEVLTQKWKCRFVLGSGSLPRLWENARLFAGHVVEPPPSMLQATTAALGAQGELDRVVFRTNPVPQTLASLCSWIKSLPGARLVVMNTLQSAAALARQLKCDGVRTLHLSTALTPSDRDQVLAEVRKLLKPQHRSSEGWVLVATSCIEAGVDVTFDIALRERCSIASLIQIGGRANRHGAGPRAEVWDFTAADALFTPNPSLAGSREVVQLAFQQGRWDADLGDLMTWAIEEEWKRFGNDKDARIPRKAEQEWEFSKVAQLSQLIDDDSALAVVDRTLVEQLKQKKPVRHIDLTRGSVSIRKKVIQELALCPLNEDKQLYEWPDSLYDNNFLGIMRYILEIKSAALAKLVMS
jgi:CRISPR-associated endonuclease/helicase Cas3